ncbi:hypothetical protein [Streptomyces arenae]|uniref:hypothetical protein n=1 Tax=Streptomyces arenae TaxID=29301 RepID=UPI002657EFC4|nr:hypothetical protein [Streptomyces arenae]MCG7205434.1 hypothetical protein [Streptomyces arenae]
MWPSWRGWPADAGRAEPGEASKIAHRPVGLTLGAAGGIAAGALCKQTWKGLGHDEDAADTTAAVDRADATAVRL